ncbi:hypothetical protein AAVH_27606 [Aphelenchoides avenae]|nr:hypothetical protein AAVH_27606 [Aphelenchus avenae]
MVFGPKYSVILCIALTAFYVDHVAAEQNVYTQSLFGYRDMYYGANFTTGSLSDGEPVQPFTLTLWLTGSSLSVAYETLHGYCNTFEHYASSQYTYVDDYGDGYYELEDSVAFYDNGSRLFYADAFVMAVSNVTTTSAVTVWTTNAFDGFFGIYTVLADGLLPVNQSVISVLLRRTCDDGYTANAGYITYGGIHPLCDILAVTPLDKKSGLRIYDAPSIRITTVRHGKNTVGVDSGGATLDSLEQNIVLPKDVFYKLQLNATKTERGFTVDCDSRPEIAFTFNETSELVVTARELMYKVSQWRKKPRAHPLRHPTVGATCK